MSNLYLLMGAPGSGKSTWIASHLPEAAVCISRDVIRFSLVGEDEEYFSKEKEVFKQFVNEITKNLKNGIDVYADATHLNAASRGKLLRSIDYHNYNKVNIIWVKTDLKTALDQNEERKGTRSYVPRDVIRRMFYQTTMPDFSEGFNTIYIVEQNKPIKIIKEE